eukprot:jgi/Tetstr1/436654/TSEL_025449.t1
MGATAIGAIEPSVVTWGGAATVRVRCGEDGDGNNIAPDRLQSLALQECTLEGVCQWLGKLEVDREGQCEEASFPVQRGLAAEWVLHLEAEFSPTGLWDLFRKPVASQVLLSAAEGACQGALGCQHEIKEGDKVTIQVDYEAPYAPPLADANLQLLAINFSAYAVKDFPYTSYAAPLDGDCEQWALVSESHDCETGAHSGLWAGLRLGGGGDGAPTGGNTSASAPLVIAAFKGTDFSQIEEIKTDLTMHLVECRLGDTVVGRCARGFLEAYQSIRDSVLGGLSAAARWLGGKEADLLIAGHSLGGAMATLLLADLLLHPDAVPFPVRSTTAWHFGTPMVGDEEFSRRLTALEHQASRGGPLHLRDHVRVVNTDAEGTTDFITHYPICVPRGMSRAVWGHHPEMYAHAGRRQYLADPGSEPTLAAGLPVPNKRLMAEPGVECLMDLLAKGANWLHDERDTYLPRSKARSPDGSAHIQGGCSRRFGDAPNIPVQAPPAAPAHESLMCKLAEVARPKPSRRQRL